MGKLLFKEDAIIANKVVFEAGKTYEISNELGSYDRWVKRGAIPVADGDLVEPETEVTENEEIKVEIDPAQQMCVEVSPENFEDFAISNQEDPEVVAEPVVVNEAPKKENKKAKKSSK